MVVVRAVSPQEQMLLQHGVVTLEQARAWLTEDQIRGKLERGEWIRLYRGVFAEAARLTYESRVQAAVFATRGIATYRCAAALFKIDGFDGLCPVEVSTERDCRATKGALIHTMDLGIFEPTIIAGGIAVSDPLSTIMTVGRFAHRDAVEGAVDWAVRNGWCTWQGLAHTAAQMTKKGVRGPKKIRDILRLRAPQYRHTDSLLETRLLQLTRRFKLPKPVLQYPLIVDGQIIARADFAYPEKMLLIETLGKFHLNQLTEDCARANAITVLRKYAVLSFTWEQVMGQPAYVAGEIRRMLG